MAAAPQYDSTYVVQPAPTEVFVQATPGSLAVLATLALLVAGWAAAVPFAGASFGFGADGHAAWVWDLHRVVLALLPGIAGMAAALVMLAALPVLRRDSAAPGLVLAGILMVLAGAWLVVGPAASAVVLTGGYFAHAAPLRALADRIGWSLGPGLVLVLCGAFAVGWSLRQRRVLARLAPLTSVAAVPLRSAAAPVAAGPVAAGPVAVEPVALDPPAVAAVPAQPPV